MLSLCKLRLALVSKAYGSGIYMCGRYSVVGVGRRHAVFLVIIFLFTPHPATQYHLVGEFDIFGYGIGSSKGKHYY